MALDYSMMRGALDTATAAELARAQSIGASASDLGFTGAHQWNEIGGKQGLMSFLKGGKKGYKNFQTQLGYDRQYQQNKPKYDAMYQQGLTDNPGLLEDDDQYWDNPDNFGEEGYSGNQEEEMTPAIWDTLNENDKNVFRANLKKKKNSGSWYNKLGWLSPSASAQTPFEPDLEGSPYVNNDETSNSTNNQSIFNNEKFVDPLSQPGAGTTYQNSNLLDSAMNKGSNVEQDYLSSGKNQVEDFRDEALGNINENRDNVLGNMTTNRDSILSLAQTNEDKYLQQSQDQKDNPIATGAKQMDAEFGEGFSNLKPDFRMAFKKSKGRSLPNKYSTNPEVLEYLESQGINPWDVQWTDY